MVPSMVNDLYIIRFAVCAKHALDDDMHAAFHIIQDHADIILAEYYTQRNGRQFSSNDSLELTNKQVSNSKLEQNTSVFEETVNPKALAETVVNRAIYPMTRVRVNKRNENEIKKEYLLI